MTDKIREEIEEVKNLCSKIFISWGLDKDYDPAKHNMEILILNILQN